MIISTEDLKRAENTEIDPRANWLLLCFNFKDDWVLFGIAHIIRVLVAVVNIGDNPAICLHQLFWIF
jgi:hypothetical protein